VSELHILFRIKVLAWRTHCETAESLVEDHFLVVNAGDLFESSLITQMTEKFRGDADIVLSCKPVEETWKFGIITVKGDRVMGLVEKPPKGEETSSLAVIGVYLMSKRIFESFRRIPVSDHQYEDANQLFIECKNNVGAVSYDGFFAGYKYTWDLFKINSYLMDTKLTKPTIEDEVYISDTLRLRVIFGFGKAQEFSTTPACWDHAI